MDRQRFSGKTLADEDRDHATGFRIILARPDHVVVPQDGVIEAGDPADNPAVRLARELTHAIVRDRQRRNIIVMPAIRVAEHRARRRVDVFLDTIARCSTQKPQRAERINCKVALRIVDAYAILGRSKMKDTAHTCQPGMLCPLQDVLRYELEPRMI
jgi:hypothetical protein